MKQLFADYHLKKSSIIFLLSFAFASGARICPEVCKCISNSYDDPEAELTYVDCAYKNLSAFPETLPHSTVELMMQGNHIDTLNRPILGTAFSDEGSPYTMTLQKLHLLRVSDTRINWELNEPCFMFSSTKLPLSPAVRQKPADEHNNQFAWRRKLRFLALVLCSPQHEGARATSSKTRGSWRTTGVAGATFLATGESRVRCLD